MVRGTPDDRYLHWLYSQVADVRTRRSSKTYWDLLRQMYKIEFAWFVPNDKNRAVDGIQLRHDWIAETGASVDLDWLLLDCSFLEMLVALTKRAEFQSEQTSEHWFWHILENLGFREFHDRYGYSESFVARRIKLVNERKYFSDGMLGMFPMLNPEQDQRNVEIWYQLCEYILQDP